MTAATTERPTKQFKNLTMIVVQEWPQNHPLVDEVRYQYKKFDTSHVMENKGDKDIIRTSFLDVRKGANNNLNQAFLEALPTYQAARMEASAVIDRAEHFELPTPKYEEIYAMMFFDKEDVQVLADTLRISREHCIQADNNPMIKRVFVSTDSLQNTLADFGLTVDELTAEALKEKTDLDVLVAPDAFTGNLKDKLPENVLLFSMREGDDVNAKEIVAKTNAYFLGK